MAALTRRVQGQPPRSKRPRSFPKRDSGIDGTIHRAVARRRLTGPRPPERDRGVYRGGRAGQQKGGAESWARYHAWNPMRVPIRKESQVALSVLSSAILRGVDPSSRSQSIRSTFSTFCVGDRSCDCIVLVCLSLSGSHRRSAAVGGSGPQMRPWIERLVRASPQWPAHCQLKRPWYARRVGGAAARVGELLCSPIMLPCSSRVGPEKGALSPLT
jgi:hypothetical protein